MTDYSCELPWSWMIVDASKNNWRFCCKTAWIPDFANTYDQHNNKRVIEIRDEFAKGNRPNACSSCWREEDLNGVSYRTKIMGATTIDKLPERSAYKYMDIVFSNICNLRCASCGPVNSSSWSSQMKMQPSIPYVWLAPTDEQELTQQIWEKLLRAVEENATTLSHINLYGGEPSMDPNFITLIDRLSDVDFSKRTTPMRIVTYTNGMWPNDKAGARFVAALVRAKEKNIDIQLKFSIDGIGEDSEFIRHPTEWAVVEKHLQDMVDFGLTKTVHITTSMLNVPVLHTIAEYFADVSYGHKITPVQNLANRPYILGVANLGNRITRYEQTWKRMKVRPQWSGYGKWLQSLCEAQRNGNPDQTNIQQFIDYVDWYADVNQIQPPNSLYNSYLSYIH